MSVSTLTIDGEDYVLIPHYPDWTIRPQRVRSWLDGMADAVVGSEYREAFRAATDGLGVEILPYDLVESQLLQQRVVAARKTGLAVIPYWGRGIRLSGTASGTTVPIEPTRWVFRSNQYVFFRRPGVEEYEAWEAVQIELQEPNSLTLASPLVGEYAAGTFCWPVLWGEFESEDTEVLNLGRGTLQIRVTQRVPYYESVSECEGIYELFEDYTLGDISEPALLVGGCGWASETVIAPNTIASVARDFWSYALGTVSGTLSGGVGWQNAWSSATNLLASVAVEDFSLYNLGAITGAEIVNGTGWTGETDITPN